MNDVSGTPFMAGTNAVKTMNCVGSWRKQGFVHATNKKWIMA
jgi:hypothetical protein